jgi:hypothetical protein
MAGQRICFIDLDGVLVDFFAGALRQHARELPYHETRWNFHHQLGMTDDEFWVPLGFEFWRDLPWHDDGHEILRVVEDIFGPDRIAILSDPGQRRGVDAGKRAWIRAHLPLYARRTFLGTDKFMIASPSKFLVDDNDGHIETFTTAGGRAVLVPRPWNERRDRVLSNGRFDIEALADELLTMVRG